jgi:hypothetical protein
MKLTDSILAIGDKSIDEVYRGNQLVYGLLDRIKGSVTAYSTRKLKSSATKSMRVRRSSDDTEMDIGFVGNSLDTSALLAFCGVGSGFVTKWYDQSGNNRDMLQAVKDTQPRIVNAGVIETMDSGEPCVYLDTTAKILQAETASHWNFLHDPSGGSMYMAHRFDDVPTGLLRYWFSTRSGTTGIFWGARDITDTDRMVFFAFENTVQVINYNTIVGAVAFQQDSILRYEQGIARTNNVGIFNNGTLIRDANYNTPPVGGFDADFPLRIGGTTIRLAEMIFFAKVLSSDQSIKLEDSQKRRYSIA